MSDTTTASGHHPLRLGLLVVTIVVFVAAILLSLPQSFPDLEEAMYGALPDDSVQGTDINPPGWAFSIWGPIYIWQVVLLGYHVAAVVRRDGPGGARLYVAPVLFTPAFYVTYMLSFALGVGWLASSSTGRLDIGLAMIIPMFATAVAALALTVFALGKHELELRKLGLNKDVWMVRWMVHNAVGLYVGWLCVAWLLNLGTVVHGPLYGGFDRAITTMVQLSILGVELITWAILDMVFFHRYTNYLLTPYVSVIWAVTASFIRQTDRQREGQLAHEMTRIYTAVLLATAILAAIMKFVLMLVRHFRTGSQAIADSSENLPEKVPVP